MEEEAREWLQLTREGHQREGGPHWHTENTGVVNRWELTEDIKTYVICANNLIWHELLSKAHYCPDKASSPFSGKVHSCMSPFLRIFGFQWSCRSKYSHQRADQLCSQGQKTRYLRAWPSVQPEMGLHGLGHSLWLQFAISLFSLISKHLTTETNLFRHPIQPPCLILLP